MTSVKGQLSSNLWLALEHLYDHRHQPSVEERFVGMHLSVVKLAQRDLARWVGDPTARQGYRRVAITPHGIEYYRTHLRYYRDVYPGLYAGSALYV